MYLIAHNRDGSIMDDLVPHNQALPAFQNPAMVYLASLGESSRRTMQNAVGRLALLITGLGEFDKEQAWLVAERIPWGSFDYQHAIALKQKLIEFGYSPAGVNKHLAALRGVLKNAWLLGHMTNEQYQRAKEVKSISYTSLPSGRELSIGEIGALLNVCNTRDAAIIALLYACGLRRSELCGIDLADVDLDKGELIIRGKGNKERMAYLSNGGLDALKDWIAQRGDSEGPLFMPITKSGAILEDRRVSTNAIYTMLKRRAAQAKVPDFTPHDLRRTFVSHLLHAGAGLSLVSKMAGHANISTTVRYDLRSEQDKIKASQLLHVPYSPN